MSPQQQVLGIWLCLLVLLQQTVTAFGLEGLQLQSNGKYGLVVPLDIRHGVHRVRGRSLLRSGIMPVQGAVKEGYFYAQLGLGTPPRNFSTIIDTGSTVTYIPCANCRHCGKHMDPGFDPSKSSTAQMLDCQHKLCECGSPGCSCMDKKCYYTRHYAEQSSSEGWLVLDKLQFPDKSSSSLDFVFGCENSETGAIYSQRVDGVLGMGNNVNSFPRQLARSGKVDDVFSLCFGFPRGGSMLLGDVPLDSSITMSYTPLIDRGMHYYNIDLRSISLSGKSLAVSVADYAQGYGTVLDSGTTFTYLPTRAFNAFVNMVYDAIKGKMLTRTSGLDPQYNDICWKGAPPDFQDIGKYFPTGAVNLADGVSFKLTPQRYLFTVSPGEYCLGIFDNGYQGTLIGGIIVRNVLVQYDKVRSRVGFAEVDCNNIRTAAKAPSTAGDTPAAPAPQPAASDDQSEEYSSDSDYSTQPESGDPEQQQQEEEDGQQSGVAHGDDDRGQGRQDQQASPSIADSSSSSSKAPDSGDSTHSSRWQISSYKDLLLGFFAGAVLVAVVMQGVNMYFARRRRHTGGGIAGTVDADGVGYREVRLSELDIETELTPLAKPGASLSSSAV